MKNKNILIISFAYPPLAAIGARRIAMIAKELSSSGYTPYVLTAKNPPQKHTLDNLISDDLVYHINWRDIWKLKYQLDKLFLTRPIGKVIEYVYPFGSNTIPERRRSFWINPAIEKGMEIIEKYDIDLIYSSYSPPASIRVASALKQATGIPWINEYRDLWTGNPYLKLSKRNKRKNYNLEKSLIKNVDALVTVSEPLKEDLIKLHNKPTYVIYNGIDLDVNMKLEDNIQMNNTNKVEIVYAGSIYKGKRDPLPLFEALNILKIKNPILYKKLTVNFYGPNLMKILKKDIEILELEDVVKLNNSVSHKEVLKIQEKADILLLLGWNNKADEGVLTGKIFEYLGMKKPILALGYKNGAIDKVLKQTNTGEIINEPKEIYKYLVKMSNLTKNDHELKSFKKNILIESFSRKNQVSYLIDIFNNYIKK